MNYAVAATASAAHHEHPPTATSSTNTSNRLCVRCRHPNPDLILPSCQCTLHARCTPVPIRQCPNPHHAHLPLTPGCPLELLPMDFTALDEAKRSNGSGKKGGKHQQQPAKKKARTEQDITDNNDDDTSTSSALCTSLSTDLRTGRWTAEETLHCDSLIHQFMSGKLPLTDGLKLNEFLSNMLKSKQSRLTKKMKNAKLSSKTFQRTMGYLSDEAEAIQFSSTENAFFNSISSPLEKAELIFHTGKEWREAFSSYCVSHGQALNADKWLVSVEEMERRNMRVKEVERVKRREMMMGCALRRDMMNHKDRGVCIDGVRSFVGGDSGGGASFAAAAVGSSGAMDANQDQYNHANVTNQMTYQNNNGALQDPSSTTATTSVQESQNTASPFLRKIISFIQRHHVPFEYVDVWVPSFVPDESSNSNNNDDGTMKEEPKCRLCYAGSSITKQVILETNTRRTAVPLSPEDAFNLSSFGDYSESFSFDVGCGLPGRVYNMGVPTWEQSVHNAPLHHFERVGGAQQWGIRTVVGIPVPSPNVGRVVVVLYSRYDRVKDHDLVIRLTEEFTRLMPSPKWKLVVDVGEVQQVVPMQQQQQQVQGQQQQGVTNGNDNNALASEVISMFGEHMPSDPSNPGFAYLQGFMSLRLLLLRTTRSPQEQDIVNTILASYSSYKAGGRTRPDMALMLARDFMFLNQQTQVVQVPNTGQAMQMNGHVGNIMQQQQQQQQYIPVGNTSMHAPAPVMVHPPQQQQHQHQQAPSSEHSASSYSSQAISQNQQSYTMPPQDAYFMMGDIEPAPVNVPPQNNDSNNNQTPLDAAVDNVESLLSPENTGSVGGYNIPSQ